MVLLVRFLKRLLSQKTPLLLKIAGVGIVASFIIYSPAVYASQRALAHGLGWCRVNQGYRAIKPSTSVPLKQYGTSYQPYPKSHYNEMQTALGLEAIREAIDKSHFDWYLRHGHPGEKSKVITQLYTQFGTQFFESLTPEQLKKVYHFLNRFYPHHALTKRVNQIYEQQLTPEGQIVSTRELTPVRGLAEIPGLVEE